ncbi:Uncharacterised protein family UPF0642 [Ceraceosorus bombacis]|uniref:Uncharacterized protein family UPF0642 n=1 Tax=Ceraceosorus bombacis TaxID=401625 RepID=A0A0P1B9U7_9BASI|nr:Uncharacterised protein family UPF0642 [Ceraceosorus bombacis]
MAKSLRSRAKLAHRQAKRTNPNSDYAITNAARTNAIAQRLAARMNMPKEAHKDGELDAEEQEEGEMGNAAQAMETDAGTSAKPEASERISTGGARESGRETWRKARGMKVRKSHNPTGFGARSKNGGKTKRRR